MSLVLFRAIALNSQDTGNLFWRVLSLDLLPWSDKFLQVFRLRARYWCSYMTFTSAPLSGSILTMISFDVIGAVLSESLTLLTFTFPTDKCLTDSSRKSLSRSVSLSESSVSEYWLPSLMSRFACDLRCWSFCLQTVYCCKVVPFAARHICLCLGWFLSQYMHALDSAGIRSCFMPFLLKNLPF